MSTAIKIENIQKQFATFQALKGIDLEIQQGEFFGLLGPNGAGKTTLISILAGLAHATQGKISIMGHDVVQDYQAARRLIGVVPQELTFDPFFTVREMLRIQSGYFGLRKNDAWIEEVMHNLDLSDKANKNMRQLSGGMKRRVLIAQALVHRPPIIVLDEPTAGVDVELRHTLWAFISRLNREGHTVLLTTHYLEEAEALCHRIAMLKSGKIVALDHTKQLLRRLAGIQLNIKFSQGELPQEFKNLVAKTSAEGELSLCLSSYEQVETILAKCREAGCVVEEMSVKTADLEEVFVQIMSEQ